MGLYNYISRYKKFDKADENVIKFGLEMLYTIVISGGIALLIALYMKSFFKAVIFLSVLMPLRQNAGGYHADKRIICAIISLFIYVLALYVIKYVNISGVVQFLIFVMCSMYIIRYAPVDSINNKLDDMEYAYYKLKTRRIVVIISALFTLLYIWEYYYWSQIIIEAVSISTGLLIIGNIKNKIVKDLGKL